VRERASQMLAEIPGFYALLCIALDHLSLGRAHLFAVQRGAGGSLAQTTSHLAAAVDGLRRAGYQDHLPLGLLARAALHTHTLSFALARKDLDDALSLCTRCGFRLHEADAHLGLARLSLAEDAPLAALDHLAKVRAIIDATGYHRRDEELAGLEAEARERARNAPPAVTPPEAPAPGAERAGRASIIVEPIHHPRRDNDSAHPEVMPNNPSTVDALVSLLPAQFDILLFRLTVPQGYLSGTQAPPATRATDLLRWAEQQGRTADLEHALAHILGRATAPDHGTAEAPTPAPDHPAGTPVDFLFITAIEEERDALLSKLPGARKLDRDGSGAHTYYEAFVATRRQDGAVYRVVVTSLSGMGPIKGAIKAGAVIQRWKPAHVIVVGIAGGVAGEVAPGDVMVASQVVDHTVGKVRDGAPREERWTAYPADADLLDAAGNFPTGWEDLVASRPPEVATPRRHVGVVASGGDVVASPEQIRIYLADWPKLIGVEMEGGGVAAGVHDDIARPRFLMIRGVSDLANGEDNAGTKKAWRSHACHVASAYAIGLLRDGPVKAALQSAPHRPR
jgi:nucleoside phosphorylase